MRLKICIFCLICAFFFGCDDSRSAFGSSEKLSILPCDLNSQICEKEFNGTKVKFEISPKPILAMEKHILKIQHDKHVLIYAKRYTYIRNKNF